MGERGGYFVFETQVFLLLRLSFLELLALAYHFDPQLLLSNGLLFLPCLQLRLLFKVPLLLCPRLPRFVLQLLCYLLLPRLFHLQPFDPILKHFCLFQFFIQGKARLQDLSRSQLLWLHNKRPLKLRQCHVRLVAIPRHYSRSKK